MRIPKAVGALIGGAVGVTMLLVPAVHAPVSAAAPGPAFVTLQFGRTGWVGTTRACVVVPGAVDLGAVAAELQRRGYTGVGAIVLDRTSEETRKCINKLYQSASWEDIDELQEMGWSFVSAGQDYANMTTLTPEELYAESCGTLDAFAEKDIDASGEFAYPNNKSTTAMQADIISTCFAWGRQYQVYGATTLAGSGAPWFQFTHSLRGGKCNEATRPCYTSVGGATTRYQLPARLGQWLTGLKPDEWATLQAYRFVVGSHGTFPTWDCRSTDPRAHWTSQTELYCWNDYLAVLDKVPSTALVTDPGTVARTWGRIPVPPVEMGHA